MVRKMVVLGVALVLSFIFCSVSEAVDLKKGEVYRSLDGEAIIEVISGSELEITEGGKTTVAKYGFKDGKLRAVFGDTVIYFEITKVGLKHEKTGWIYYSKSALSALEKNVLEELKKSMVFVKGGCFQMGDTFGDGESDEKSVHEVCVDDISIGKYEVTQGQWKAIMGSNPSSFKDCGDNCPVEQVSWDDIQEFINKLNQKNAGAGLKPAPAFRLPTEAEWEYAARSGGKNEKYAGGNDIDSVAWYYSNSDNKTHPVGTKAPNGLGLYDMTGNVWEWVQDWYDSGYYKNSPKDNPKGASSGSFRVDRGGSWLGSARFARAGDRNCGSPGSRYDFLGFRLAGQK